MLKINSESSIKKGIGKIHAKWSPVSTCTMRKQPVVTLDNEKLTKELSETQKKQLVKKCPRKVYAYNPSRKVIDIENMDNCSLCQECVKFSEDLGVEKAIKVSENDMKFIFTVESTGALECDYIITQSMKILQRKLTSLQECMAKYSIIQ